MDSSENFNTEQRIISLCSGYGGLDRGVREIINTRTVTYVEIEAFQVFNLASAMEAGMVDQAPVWTDLKTFDGKPFHKKIHGIIGGYPCQGESLAGKRQLWNDERFLYPYIEKIIDSVRPLWCFFENVEGHLSGSFPYILESLQGMGYRVEAGLFSAEEVGATHRRKRLFMLAVANTGSERLNRNLMPSRRIKEFSEPSMFYKPEKWPARPNEQQFEWEEPISVKPGLGCTVNGYNFRTELLRQYGNGVVHQTAALAFRTLLDKITAYENQEEKNITRQEAT